MDIFTEARNLAQRYEKGDAFRLHVRARAALVLPQAPADTVDRAGGTGFPSLPAAGARLAESGVTGARGRRPDARRLRAPRFTLGTTPAFAGIEFPEAYPGGVHGEAQHQWQ